MNKSASISNLVAALVEAQKEMPAVKMNAVNPFLKNKYADLEAVIESTKPTLTKHGLTISQFPTSKDNQIGLTSILMHTSGEWLEDTIFVTPEASKGLSVAQAAGVIISYLRRYQWQSIIGVYGEQDTDGASLQRTTAKAETKTPAPASDELTLAKKEFASVWNMLPPTKQKDAVKQTPNMTAEQIRAASAQNRKLAEVK